MKNSKFSSFKFNNFFDFKEINGLLFNAHILLIKGGDILGLYLVTINKH